MRHDEPRPRKRRRPPTRRKTVRWSAREVEALLAGVRHHGVGKWATILRHSKVFNGVRTSVDLKDKWRNLTSPVRAAALSGHPISDPAALGVPSVNDLNEDHPQPQHLHSPPCSPAHTPEPSPLPNGPPRSPQNSLSDPKSLAQLQHPAQQVLCQSPCPSQSGSQGPSQSHMDPDSSGENGHHDVVHIASKEHVDDVMPEPKLIHPPPSESSVSPEVLSTPGVHAAQQDTPQIGGSMPLQPEQSNSQQRMTGNVPYPYSNANSPQVAAMQRVMEQSLYHSASMIAAYWRRMGVQPNPYSIAAALTANPSMMNMFCAPGSASTLFQHDDDDDDDDDLIIPQYPLSVNPLFNADAVQTQISPNSSQNFPSQFTHNLPVTFVNPSYVDPNRIDVHGNSNQGAPSNAANVQGSVPNEQHASPSAEDKTGQVDVKEEEAEEDGGVVSDRVKNEDLELPAQVPVDEEDHIDAVGDEDTAHLDYLNVEEFPSRGEHEQEDNESMDPEADQLSRDALEETRFEMSTDRADAHVLSNGDLN